MESRGPHVGEYRVVDTYWRLMWSTLPVSVFAFTLELSTCDVFLFLISVVCRVVEP